MHPRQHLPAEAVALASAQAGVISRKFLVGAGMSRKAIDRLSADWHRLGRGLFCLEPPSWDSAVWAGLVSAGPDAVVGGLAAAHLTGWEPRKPGDITVWCPKKLEPLEVGDWRVRFRQGHRRGRGDPTRTLPEDTILDAASETTADGTIHVLARAITGGRTTTARVEAVMGQRGRQAHRRLIEQACQHGMDGVESILEWRYSTEVEAAHGLPAPIRQARLNHFSRQDLLYRDHGVVVELDGRLGHEKHRDYRRDNRNLINHNVVTLRYGWDDVISDPCGVAAQVGRCLRMRGWQGDVRRCRRCRRMPG